MDLEFDLFLLETKTVVFLHTGLVGSMLALVVRLRPKSVLKLLVSMESAVVDLRLCPCCDSGHTTLIDLSGGLSHVLCVEILLRLSLGGLHFCTFELHWS